jgi:hypothetical protein
VRKPTDLQRLLLVLVIAFILILLATFAPAQTEHRYLVMPSGWESPAAALEPTSSGSQLEQLLARAADQMKEYTDGRHSFVFDVAARYRVKGAQPLGPLCDYGSWLEEVRLAALAAGHGAGVNSFLHVFAPLPALCPSNTAWATWSGNGAWFEQITEDIVAHEIAGHEGVGVGGIREHAASAICTDTPVGGFAFDVRTCHAHERGDPTTIMGVGQRFTFREYVNNGLRTPDQRLALSSDVVQRDVTIERLEQISGVQNVIVSGVDDTYNFTLRTPVGVDAAWARVPKVTIHGWVDGFDAYIYSMVAGDVFLNLRGGFSVEALSVGMQSATLRVKYFAATPDAPAPPTPTPAAWTPDPTPPPAECWELFPFIRCTPTPAPATPTETPTPTPTSSPAPSTPTETPTPEPTATEVPTSAPPAEATATPPATVTPWATPVPLSSPGCKTKHAAMPGELLFVAVVLAAWRRRIR